MELNESTASADASVEAKATIAILLFTHLNIFAYILLHACRITEKLIEWVIIDHDCC